MRFAKSILELFGFPNAERVAVELGDERVTQIIETMLEGLDQESVFIFRSFYGVGVTQKLLKWLAVK